MLGRHIGLLEAVQKTLVFYSGVIASSFYAGWLEVERREEILQIKVLDWESLTRDVETTSRGEVFDYCSGSCEQGTP